MNLRCIANNVTQSVNLNTDALIREGTGYTINNGKRTPVYGDSIPVKIQVQALTNKELEHLEFLNLQGVMRSVYLDGNWTGIVRSDKHGGDILLFSDKTWLIVAVLESWHDWTKVAVWQQI